jgi:glycosyltransferase involved in cell wall biosynthesis
MRLDVVYLAWNRLKFVGATWPWMMSHTNWDYVERLIVYDDGSEDGTLEFLREHTARDIQHHHRKIPVELRLGDFRSPPAIMNHYLATSEADVFAKIDSDIALPGGWLEALLSVMEGRKKPDLLGMEAGMVELAGRDGKRWDGRYTFEPATNIGGIGLMRVSAFKTRPPIPARVDSRFGFTEWQQRYDLKRGWIRPDLLCPQLDRLPFEPWASLAEQYVAEGWSRPWPKYHPEMMSAYWSWMDTKQAVA